MKFFKTLISIFAFLGSFQSLQAYPNFISLGYESCLACHYNPFGNGQLSDYGRVVGATGISDRLFSNKKTSEEDLADASDFFFGKVKGYSEQNWIRPQMNYRGLYYMRDTFGGKNPENEYISMDLSTSVAIKLFKDKLIAVGQIGYAPIPASREGTDMEEYRSREHYIGYRPVKSFGVYAGLMDKVFGIRVPDHIALSRSYANLDQNDQTHGALVHYAHKKFEVGIQGFMGNLVQDEKLRQKGVTAQGEFSTWKNARAGLSVLSSKSEYVENTMYAAHLRTGVGKGHSIMAEIGQVQMAPNQLKTIKKTYLFNQNHYMLRRGLFALCTIEYGKPNSNTEDTFQRYSGGMQFFPANRIETRLDIYNTRTENDQAEINSYQIAAQIHFWL